MEPSLGSKNAIHINALSLTDEQQGEAVLRGAIHHQAFQDFRLELVADVEKFLTGLNTTYKDNKHFYGTGIVSGKRDFIWSCRQGSY